MLYNKVKGYYSCTAYAGDNPFTKNNIERAWLNRREEF
jgi:hypothetical protein